MPRITLHAATLALALGLGLAAAAQEQQARLQHAVPVLDGFQGGWAPLPQNADWEADAPAAKKAEGTLQQELDAFRMERNRALARSQGSLPPADRDRLRQGAEALQARYPGTFEAELAAYYAAFPAPSAFAHLDAAARLGAGREELVGPALTAALHDGDAARLRAAAREVGRRGGVAPGLMVMADDLLLSVDRDAVLLVAGEMDGFPVLVRQHAEGQRPDVRVIDVRLLDEPAYRAAAWRLANAEGDAPGSAAAFTDRLPGATARPVFASLALGREWAARNAGRMRVTGLAARLGDEDCCSIQGLARTWAAMRKTAGAGPLSRNYLLPASLLLKHYRSEGNEEQAARLEHEVRQLAQRLGMTAELQSNGILPH